VRLHLTKLRNTFNKTPLSVIGVSGGDGLWQKNVSVASKCDRTST
jgi:hypothetical protein